MITYTELEAYCVKFGYFDQRGKWAGKIGNFELTVPNPTDTIFIPKKSMFPCLTEIYMNSGLHITSDETEIPNCIVLAINNIDNTKAFEYLTVSLWYTRMLKDFNIITYENLIKYCDNRPFLSFEKMLQLLQSDLPNELKNKLISPSKNPYEFVYTCNSFKYYTKIASIICEDKQPLLKGLQKKTLFEKLTYWHDCYKQRDRFTVQ